MKPLIILLLFFITSCSTSDIALNREAMNSIKTIAIAPFTSNIELKKGILTEAEGIFRSAFVKLNYRVVERERLNTILKEKELSMAGVTAENAKTIGTMLGADAILIGEITSREEYQKEIQDFETKKVETKTFYKFQIIVRLVDTVSGSVILTVKNASSEAMQDKELAGFSSLDSYCSLILKEMEVDLVQSISKKL